MGHHLMYVYVGTYLWNVHSRVTLKAKVVMKPAVASTAVRGEGTTIEMIWW